MRHLLVLLTTAAVILGALSSLASAQTPAAGAAAPAAPAASAPSPGAVIPYNLDPNAYVVAPAPEPNPSTLNVAPTSTQVLYVVADGGDAATRGRFVSEVARQLQSYYTIPSPGLILVPEPTWSVADYINGCTNGTANTKTRGALIVKIASISNSSANWFWQKASWTELSGALLFSACIQDHTKSSSGSGSNYVESTPNPLTAVSQKDITWQFGPKMGSQRIKYSMFNTPKPKEAPPAPYSMRWATNVYDQTGYTKNITPLPVAGVVLALVSAGIPFIPSRTSTGVDNIAYPTPYPWLPGSSNGYVSSRQTTNTTTTNVQNETTLATGFLSSSISYDQNLNALPSTSDDSSMRAVRNVVAGFLTEIGCAARVVHGAAIKPNTYGTNLTDVQVHSGMCADLAIDAGPSKHAVAPLKPDILGPTIVSILPSLATVRGPNSDYACASPTPPPPNIAQASSPTSPPTPPPCGVEVIATIQNLTGSVPLPPSREAIATQPKPVGKTTPTPLAADLFRIRCRAYDQHGLLINHEAAEAFGPLPLDPGDGSDYRFYLSNILTVAPDEETNKDDHVLTRLQCFLSVRIRNDWYDAPKAPPGIF